MVSYTIGVDTSHATGGTETVHLSATLADGSPLPSWLKFDPASRLSGQPSPGASAVAVLVTAKDDQGHEAQTVVNVKTGATPDGAGKPGGKGRHGSIMPDSHGRAVADARLTPDRTELRNVINERPHPKARPGLTAQIRSAHRANQLARQAAFFRVAEQTIHRA